MAKGRAPKTASTLTDDDRRRIKLTEDARCHACDIGIVIDRAGNQLNAAGEIVKKGVVPCLEGCR